MYKLDTPESVAVTYPIAGVGTRFLAALVDTLVQTAVVIALLIVAFVIFAVVGGAGTLGHIAGYVALGIGTLIISAVLLGYYIFFELIWNGQSPGKRAMRLRVIQTSGYPVTPFAVLVRNVLRLVDFLPAYYAVGVITMIINKDARRLGDLAAGTIVVKEGREGALSSLPIPSPSPALATAPTPAAALTTAPAPLGYPAATAALSSPSLAPSPSYGYAGAAPAAPAVQFSGAPATGGGMATPPTSPIAGAGLPAPEATTYGIDAGRLTREDAALIRDFLDRRHALAYDRRNALAYQIASLVYTHVGGETPRFTAEGYLEYVLRLAGQP